MGISGNGITNSQFSAIKSQYPGMDSLLTAVIIEVRKQRSAAAGLAVTEAEYGHGMAMCTAELPGNNAITNR